MAQLILPGDALPGDVRLGRKFSAGTNYNALGTLAPGAQEVTGSLSLSSTTSAFSSAYTGQAPSVTLNFVTLSFNTGGVLPKFIQIYESAWGCFTLWSSQPFVKSASATQYDVDANIFVFDSPNQAAYSFTTASGAASVGSTSFNCPWPRARQVA